MIRPFCLSKPVGIEPSRHVMTPDADGNILAAHIFVTISPANASNTALATAYATNGAVSVPELPAWLYS